MIQFSVCFIVDVSGVVGTGKAFLRRLLLGKEAAAVEYRLRPFDCSLCMCFWTTLIYLLVQEGPTLTTLSGACLSACTADLMTTLIISVKEWGIRMLSLIH
ncbi:MAG: hypothetical protein LUG98_05395 [Tannerellaceae bacterium]|nr:hypothetical protein [Tannerellaceae bacterium]